MSTPRSHHRVQTPVTPLHSAQSSLSSTPSRHPGQSLTLHDYHKLQWTPSPPPLPGGRTVKRRPKTPDLHAVERVPSVSSTATRRRTPQSHVGARSSPPLALPREDNAPLTAAPRRRESPSARAAESWPLPTPEATPRPRSSASPAGVAAPRSGRSSQEEAENFYRSHTRFDEFKQSSKPIRRLPRPDTAGATAPAIASPLRYSTSSSNQPSSAGLTTSSTFSLSRFPQPPRSAGAVPTAPLVTSRPAIPTSAPATASPPLTPKTSTPTTLHYRGTSFDLVNPHDSLRESNIETPGDREVDLLDYFTSDPTADLLGKENMDPCGAAKTHLDDRSTHSSRALYDDLPSAYEKIARDKPHLFKRPSIRPPKPSASAPMAAKYPVASDSDTQLGNRSQGAVPPPLKVDKPLSSPSFITRMSRAFLRRKDNRSQDEESELQPMQSPKQTSFPEPFPPFEPPPPIPGDATTLDAAAARPSQEPSTHNTGNSIDGPSESEVIGAYDAESVYPAASNDPFEVASLRSSGADPRRSVPFGVRMRETDYSSEVDPNSYPNFFADHARQSRVRSNVFEHDQFFRHPDAHVLENQKDSTIGSILDRYQSSGMGTSSHGEEGSSSLRSAQTSLTSSANAPRMLRASAGSPPSDAPPPPPVLGPPIDLGAPKPPFAHQSGRMGESDFFSHGSSYGDTRNLLMLSQNMDHSEQRGEGGRSVSPLSGGPSATGLPSPETNRSSRFAEKFSSSSPTVEHPRGRTMDRQGDTIGISSLESDNVKRSSPVSPLRGYGERERSTLLQAREGPVTPGRNESNEADWVTTMDTPERDERKENNRASYATETSEYTNGSTVPAMWQRRSPRPTLSPAKKLPKFTGEEPLPGTPQDDDDEGDWETVADLSRADVTGEWTRQTLPGTDSNASLGTTRHIADEPEYRHDPPGTHGYSESKSPLMSSANPFALTPGDEVTNPFNNTSPFGGPSQSTPTAYPGDTGTSPYGGEVSSTSQNRTSKKPTTQPPQQPQPQTQKQHHAVDSLMPFGHAPASRRHHPENGPLAPDQLPQHRNTLSLSSEPYEEILYDDDHQPSPPQDPDTQEERARSGSYGKRPMFINPFSPNRDDSFGKLAVLGPKANFTGTPEGSNMRDAGSSLAGTSGGTQNNPWSNTPTNNGQPGVSHAYKKSPLGMANPNSNDSPSPKSFAPKLYLPKHRQGMSPDNATLFTKASDGTSMHKSSYSMLSSVKGHKRSPLGQEHLKSSKGKLSPLDAARLKTAQKAAHRASVQSQTQLRQLRLHQHSLPLQPTTSPITPVAASRHTHHAGGSGEVRRFSHFLSGQDSPLAAALPLRPMARNKEARAVVYPALEGGGVVNNGGAVGDGAGSPPFSYGSASSGPRLYPRYRPDSSVWSRTRRRKSFLSWFAFACLIWFPPLLLLFGLGVLDPIVSRLSDGQIESFGRTQKCVARYTSAVLCCLIPVVILVVVLLLHQAGSI
ncbi:hypothetical protein BDY21DRAFT_371081 [Lineolata rhizophorae]|uniref:Uncharacterized protein n=1 Tax=Lineolata rhizophorae TaxID=578093 RepID=A0A6A6P2E7_9PEZI|nr:hypothetical protein BDY21DRAFT_371081 [Lineolata rhizophorae]